MSDGLNDLWHEISTLASQPLENTWDFFEIDIYTVDSGETKVANLKERDVIQIILVLRKLGIRTGIKVVITSCHLRRQRHLEMSCLTVTWKKEGIISKLTCDVW